MKRLTLLALATALAAPAPVGAYGWQDESTLTTVDGTVQCPGTRSWRDHKKRRFWTEGRMCPLTYVQCLAGYVIDRDGRHSVDKWCSDDSEWSEGRKADY